VKPFPERGETWPYADAEAASIRDYFEQPSQRALNIAINAARNFADIYDPNRKRPNVRAQVQALGEALTEMRRALSLSNAAEKHLLQHRVESPANDPIDLQRLHSLLHQFAFENREGLQNLPPKTKAGRAENLLEKSLVGEFQKAFLAGHGGTVAKTGWPKFLRLCRDPLVRMKLLPPIGDKSLQDKTRRKNRTAKQGK
jgi:hypothetical protein